MSAINNPVYDHNEGAASSALIESFPEASGQSFKQGEFVYLVADGTTMKVTVATTSSLILGIANEDASTVEDTSIEVTVLRPQDLFEITWFSDAGTETPLLYTGYGHCKNTTNKSKLDYDDGTNILIPVKILDTTTKRCRAVVALPYLQRYTGA